MGKLNLPRHSASSISSSGKKLWTLWDRQNCEGFFFFFHLNGIIFTLNINRGSSALKCLLIVKLNFFNLLQMPYRFFECHFLPRHTPGTYL